MYKNTLKRMRDYNSMELATLKNMLKSNISTKSKEKCIDEFDNTCTGYIDCLFFNNLCNTREWMLYRRAIGKLANKYRHTIEQ